MPIFEQKLDSITDREISQVAPFEVFTRGRNYCREGKVSALGRENGTLSAQVDGKRVSVREDDIGIHDTRCSCDASPVCPHVVATLLKWTETRISSTPIRAATWAWRDFFPPGHRLDVTVDLYENGPGFAAQLFSPGTGRIANLIIPPEEAPDWITEARSRDGALFTPRAAAVRVYRQPLLPVLAADFDAKGRLEMNAFYTHKMRDFTPEEVGRGRIGKIWFWDGSHFYSIAEAPAEFRSRLLEGDAIGDFFEEEFGNLSRHVSFRPSERVKAARVVTPKAAKLTVKSSGDWLSMEAHYRAGDHIIALREILGTQNKYVRRGDTFIRKTAVEPLEEKVDRLEFIRTRAELADLEIEAPPDLTELDVKLRRLKQPSPAPLPPGLKATLRPYQKAGLDWLWFLRQNGLGGVLADDMGLGKTHQTMALLLDVYDHGATRPSLVVCPTSVLDHWVEKIGTFAPSLRTLRYYGTHRRELLKVAGDARLVLTTYSLLARDIDVLENIRWEYVILDEAQKIKNADTHAHRSAKRLESISRLALSGTPIENRVDELRSLFDFIAPGYLGSAKWFREKFEIPIIRDQNAIATENLKRIIAPFKLRRIKSEVLSELPPKIEDVRTCRMTPHQATVYKMLVDQQGKELLKGLESSRSVDYVPIFALLGKLKRLCDHPALVVENSRGFSSGKFELFKEVAADALEAGHKLVVFTQYLEMMDLIQAHLKERGVGSAELRGSTGDRGGALRRFADDPICRVFVCSLLAGGVGIDLTAASVVIHYDRWWNAAREDQATDRVHRIGQTRGVQVFKLVTQGTLEEKIDNMIREKRRLANEVIESDASLFKSFTREELAELLAS